MQVQSERIPQYLKDNGRFCSWKYERRDGNWKYEQRDGNQTKVPYMPGTTRRASVSDPSTFTAFDTAASATGYDGVGIQVCDRIVGIDLDHCIVDGKLLPWAQEIVDRFHATYIEVSPSGTGIRIICLLSDGFTYDTQTYYIKKGDIEVYIPGHTNRFLTITGNALTDADVVETAEALIWLLDTYMRRPTPSTPTIAVPSESYKIRVRAVRLRWFSPPSEGVPMTLQDKIAIQNLRLEGYRPSEIAVKLGLSASTMRSHIARHPDIPGTRVCQNCGKLLMQPKGRREKKFCSDACRMAWWNSHPESVKKKAYYHLVCQHCGKEFESYGNQNRKYCCRSCYLASR